MAIAVVSISASNVFRWSGLEYGNWAMSLWTLNSFFVGVISGDVGSPCNYVICRCQQLGVISRSVKPFI